MKFRNLVKDLIKLKDEKQIVKTVNALYIMGCLHEYLFGNYISVGWTHELAKSKIKYFNENNYRYNGKKISYKSNIEYFNQFKDEFIKISKHDATLEFIDFSNENYLKDSDYKLFDKYLL